MKLTLSVLGAAALWVVSGPAPSQGASLDVSQDHTARARDIAGAAYLPVQQHLCYLHSPEDDARLKMRRATSVLKPTRVFDNFYYVGAEDVSAWALVDPKGIILFDSLRSPQEAQEKIVRGLETLGLDPHTLRYVVITHGHGDHFGGAQSLADRYGARLVASDIDWATMHDPLNPFVAPYKAVIPKKDLSRNDGETLDLGALSIKFYLTPGHTPGTLSSIFKVMDDGRPRTVAFWGGVGLRSQRSEVQSYVAALDRFRAIAKTEGAQIGITNHPHADMTLERVSALGRFPRPQNAMVVGPGGVDQWMEVIEECAKAQIDRLNSGAGGGSP